MSETGEKRGRRAEAAPNVTFDPMTGAATVRDALKMAPDAVTKAELLRLHAYLRANPTSPLAQTARGWLHGKASGGDRVLYIDGFDLFNLFSSWAGNSWHRLDRVVRRGPGTGS